MFHYSSRAPWQFCAGLFSPGHHSSVSQHKTGSTQAIFAYCSPSSSMAKDFTRSPTISSKENLPQEIKIDLDQNRSVVIGEIKVPCMKCHPSYNLWLFMLLKHPFHCLHIYKVKCKDYLSVGSHINSTSLNQFCAEHRRWGSLYTEYYFYTSGFKFDIVYNLYS